MKKLKDNLVVFLMAFSQLLLTLFVIYWLMGQFKSEKHKLDQELDRSFMESERIMIDSMLDIHLIAPILDDSTSRNIKISVSIDSVDEMTKFAHREELFSSDDKKRFKNIDFRYLRLDSLYTNDTLGRHLRTFMDTSNSYLYHGARLIFSRMRGMDRNKNSRASFISRNADTLILKNSFSAFLEKNKQDFTVEWISLAEEKNVSKKWLVIPSRVFDATFGAKINNYQFYLIKTIFPQILFAIILLLITLTSFRISYLNIKKQKRLLHIKNEFISNVTHELKTPVATVKVALEALLDFDMKKDPDKVKDYLEMSLLEMNRLDLLIAKVLNNSVLENGQDLFIPEPLNLVQLIEEVIQSQKYRIEKDAAELIFVSELKDAKVVLDKLHFQGVLINLIDNSLKYGGSKVKIDIILTAVANNFVISIKDSGPGIPNEYTDKVFDKFFRVPTNDCHNVKGYGLGLNYAKLVLDYHQGQITVKNLIEGGCEFMLTIPGKLS